jgi:hypothetical protein
MPACAQAPCLVRAPARAFREHGRCHRYRLETPASPIQHCLTKPHFDGFKKDIAHRFTREPTCGPGVPGNDLGIAAGFHEHAGDDFAVVACDLEAIRTPTLIRLVYLYDAIMYAAADRMLRRFRQQ